MRLSTPRIRDLADASRALLSPGEHDGVDDWRREVNRILRRLFAADHAIFQLPAWGARYLSDELDGAVLGRLADASESTPAGARYRDPAMDRMYHARRRSGGEVFTRAGNERLLGLPMERTAVYADVLRPAGVWDFCGIYAPLPEGDAMLWVSHDRGRGNPLGEEAAEVLAVLAPAFRAGVGELRRSWQTDRSAELRERYRLTAREAEVAERLLGGASNKRLALELGISAHTARHHTERVFAKLGVRSRRELLAGATSPLAPNDAGG